MRTYEDRVGLPSGMVRVISCHHFISQDVFLSEQEPVALTTAQGKLLIATAQHCIEVRNLDARGNVLHSFPTVDQVKQLLYCDIGNYVATLEKKSSRHSNPVTYVRIYFNWWIDVKGQPMRVRIAGCVTPSSQYWGGQFEMVELPLEQLALAITCCKKTAAIAVSVGKVISVFCFSTKVHDISKQKFRDFDHFLNIELSFVVHELTICEGYFACMSDNQIQVLKVNFEKEKEGSSFTNDSYETKPKSSNNACQSVDKHFIEWRFESCTVNGSLDIEWEEQLKTSLHPDSFPVTIHLKSIDKANKLDNGQQKCEFYGPLTTVRGHDIKVRMDQKIFEVWPSLISTTVSAVTLLYRQFSFSEGQNGLLGLHLLPFYHTDSVLDALDPLNEAIAVSEESSHFIPWSPLSSNVSSQLKAVGCFLSTIQEGFLYNITSKPRLICSYPYTASLKSIALEPSLLHALTDTGLETYTLRLAHCAIGHAENTNNIENACPNSEEAVCLLGLRPFLGVDQLVMSENHLVLVSATDDSVSSTESIEGSSCTLYSLKKPSPQQVFLDLLEMGQFHKSSSPPTYLHLLSEAHMILRTYLFLNNKSCQPDIEELYRKSCALLADHFITCDSSEDKLLAVPYYHMSKHPLEMVVQRVLQIKAQVKQSSGILRILVQYLDSVLLDQHCEARDISQAVAEMILDIYMEEAPARLWKIILCSGISNYKIDKAILMLKRRVTSKRNPLSPASNAADTIAIVALLLKKGNVEAAQNMFLSLAKVELVPVLIDIYELLWKCDGLTAFGQLTKHTRPDAFIELLLRLIEDGKLTSAEAIHMFQKEAPGTEIHTTPLLKEFLETMFSDKKFTAADNHSLLLLTKIYLIRISENKKESSSRSSVPMAGATKSAILFGARSAWLNEMPPFNGKGISRTCIVVDKEITKKEQTQHTANFCPCWSCNDDLLRLQSLLTWQQASGNVCEQVLDFLSSVMKPIRGHSSLEVLCSDEPQAVTLLLNICPSAVLTYAIETFGTNQQKWCLIFSLLDQKIKGMAQDDPNFEIYFQTSQGVLNHLSETLHPAAFVSLLPEGQSSQFLPYVKRCCEKHQAEQLKNKIVTLGQEIKAMM